MYIHKCSKLYVTVYSVIIIMCYNHSINLLTCQLTTDVQTVANASQRVIERIKETNRRSVLAVPLVGRPSDILDAIAEEAVKAGIVVVTSAGKK